VLKVRPKRDCAGRVLTPFSLLLLPHGSAFDVLFPKQTEHVYFSPSVVLILVPIPLLASSRPLCEDDSHVTAETELVRKILPDTWVKLIDLRGKQVSSPCFCFCFGFGKVRGINA
jgi:hypothetical protein